MITRLTYPITLLLSIQRRTCESMGELIDVSGDTMLRQLESDITLKEKCSIVKDFFNSKRLIALLDDVQLEKQYSKEIEGSSDNFDSSKRASYRSLCTVVLMLGNGNYHIPVTHKFWVPEEIMGDEYQTKSEIGLQLIKEILEFCKIRVVVADALYATVSFMMGLFSLKLQFEFKMHSNRVISLETGEKGQLKKHIQIKIKRQKMAHFKSNLERLLFICYSI